MNRSPQLCTLDRFWVSIRRYSHELTPSLGFALALLPVYPSVYPLPTHSPVNLSIHPHVSVWTNYTPVIGTQDANKIRRVRKETNVNKKDGESLPPERKWKWKLNRKKKRHLHLLSFQYVYFKQDHPPNKAICKSCLPLVGPQSYPLPLIFCGQ